MGYSTTRMERDARVAEWDRAEFTEKWEKPAPLKPKGAAPGGKKARAYLLDRGN
jgi:hypothetical protein